MTDRPRRLTGTELVETLNKAMATLKSEIDEKDFAYVGAGAEDRLGLTKARLRLVIAALKDEGYLIHYMEAERPGTDIAEMVVVKVLTASDTSFKDVWQNRDKIMKLWLDAQPKKH
jgi:tRNA G26 N,N-dimethylase Trm1